MVIKVKHSFFKNIVMYIKTRNTQTTIKSEFPKLVITSEDCIIMVTEIYDTYYYKGVVLNPPIFLEYDEITTTQFVISECRPFEGTISLTNT